MEVPPGREWVAVVCWDGTPFAVSYRSTFSLSSESRDDFH